MIEKRTLKRIYSLLESGRFSFDFDAEKDILKQGYHTQNDKVNE